jgi:8-oxo-dGTP pyrophosphatase MutT (NUDIX family)
LQFAALPYRRAERLEIMLVSSRETGRWVLPKGWPIKGIKPHKTAAREALEEAGILGKVAKSPLGGYSYAKRLENGSVQICQVQVFAFEVERERNSWVEKHERTRKWFAVPDATEAVEEPELREAILKFEMFAMAKPKNAKSKKSQSSETAIKRDHVPLCFDRVRGRLKR